MVGSVRKLNPKDPASPYVYEYTGKRIRKTPKSGKRQDARALQSQISAELLSGSHTPASRTISVDQLCTEFHEQMRRRHIERRGIGATYVRNSLFAINLAIVPVIGRIKASELTFLDVERVAKAMADKGRHPRTIQMRLQLLKQIMEFGIRRGYA